MDPASPLPHHRHQLSLEGIIHFSSEPPLEPGQRAQAERKFYRIVDHCGALNTSKSGSRSNQYDRGLLVRLTYEYARSEESQDIFLRAFFQSIATSIDGETDANVDNHKLEDLRLALFRFADHLIDNFYLPCKAGPSPVYHSAIQRAQGGGVQDFVGTPERVSELRGECLVRDRHRCVVSRRFDQDEATRRMRTCGDEAKDDDGNLLQDETQFDSLEVAHILPHSLTKSETGSQLHPSKTAALAILNMFDNGVIHIIEGNNIDRPRNAITLTHNLHRLFGDFEVFFEPVSGQEPHTYRIGSFLPAPIVRGLLPVTRTLHLTKNRTIDPPSPRLLALHCAIAHILHLSAAGTYINKILEDIEKMGIQADGSTELGRLVALRIGGWLNSTVYT
ncbi:hypothetical protein CHU98_g3738 [Xylaria longipes]|nr:hypothetical protein CHU98_g3738 [Xylaria longipes]